MASHQDSPPCSADSANDDIAAEIPDSAGHSFTELETNYALDFLQKDSAQYLSGNGFKNKAFTEISAAVKKRFPTRPIRLKDTVGNCLRYVIIVSPLTAFALIFPQVKSIFEEYEFVRGKSGVGWDDGEKKATAEADFIKNFSDEHGDKYMKCFKKPCPYYNCLAELFGGNKATGAHILHLAKPKTKKAKSSSTSASTSASASASATAPSSLSPLKRKGPRQPLSSLQNDIIDIDSDSAPNQPPSPKPYDDELLPPSAKHRRLPDILGNDEESENSDQPKTKANVRDRDRSTSTSSSSGGRRASRNAEIGSEIACGLKLIGQGMSAPIITKADTSHVDAIVDAFTADPTLLPTDPDGEYYALFLDTLSVNEMRARVFIKTPNRIQRIALLKRVLTKKEMEVPLNWV
ncbi:hypothetical protein C8R44DRAFT_744837 [Mycena epipterygia]|nr:hypothetical protein C8R44DRAFT_744837 [Mycena epipterygia]